MSVQMDIIWASLQQADFLISIIFAILRSWRSPSKLVFMNFSIITVTGTLYFTLPSKAMKAKWSARGYDSFQLRDTGSVRFAIRQIRSPFMQMQNGFY
jgi:hypothetical protein